MAASRDEISQPERDPPCGPDPEVEAIGAVCAALEALQDPVARRRVLLWAQARFSVEPQWVPPPKKS
jgi:hypothetical protein